MASESELSELKLELHGRGYMNLVGERDHLSGIVHGVDLSTVSKSVPENGGPFKTLDDPEEAIPQEITELVDKYNASVSVMGHGGKESGRLHLYIE